MFLQTMVLRLEGAMRTAAETNKHGEFRASAKMFIQKPGWCPIADSLCLHTNCCKGPFYPRLIGSDQQDSKYFHIPGNIILYNTRNDAYIFNRPGVAGAVLSTGS